MKARLFSVALAALVLFFSVSALDAQQVRSRAAAGKADVAILTKTTPHWDKRVGAAGLPPIVKNTAAYLKYKGVTVGEKENSRFCLTLIVDSAALHGTVIIVSMEDAEGNALWQTGKLTGEAIPMQALFDTTPNPISMDTLYSRMHSVIDEHLDGILMYRPAEEAPAPVAEKEVSAPATDAPAVERSKLSVTSVPFAADIEVNGKFMGNAPSEIGLTPGEYLIVVSKKGYEPWQRKMTLAPGTATLNVELEKKNP